MTKIELLKKIGITIPAGATRFHTEGDEIIFHVNDWPKDERAYQGEWHSERSTLSADQAIALKEAHCIGSLGWELEVADARGYQEMASA